MQNKEMSGGLRLQRTVNDQKCHFKCHGTQLKLLLLMFYLGI